MACVAPDGDCADMVLASLAGDGGQLNRLTLSSLHIAKGREIGLVLWTVVTFPTRNRTPAEFKNRDACSTWDPRVRSPKPTWCIRLTEPLSSSIVFGAIWSRHRLSAARVLASPLSSSRPRRRRCKKPAQSGIFGTRLLACEFFTVVHLVLLQGSLATYIEGSKRRVLDWPLMRERSVDNKWRSKPQPPLDAPSSQTTFRRETSCPELPRRPPQFHTPST